MERHVSKFKRNGKGNTKRTAQKLFHWSLPRSRKMSNCLSSFDSPPTRFTSSLLLFSPVSFGPLVRRSRLNRQASERGIGRPSSPPDGWVSSVSGLSWHTNSSFSGSFIACVWVCGLSVTLLSLLMAVLILWMEDLRRRAAGAKMSDFRCWRCCSEKREQRALFMGRVCCAHIVVIKTMALLTLFYHWGTVTDCMLILQRDCGMFSSLYEIPIYSRKLYFWKL